MGFPLDFVLSDESHYREFVCKICFELVETPVAYTRCSHVFCNSCLNQWIQSNTLPWGSGSDKEIPRIKCPACNFLLTVNKDIGTLAHKEPLASRLLLGIRCRCPLGDVGGDSPNEEGLCRWTGDYSEVQSHLMDSESHVGGRVPSSSGVASGVGGGAGSGMAASSGKSVGSNNDDKMAVSSEPDFNVSSVGSSDEQPLTPSASKRTRDGQPVIPEEQRTSQNAAANSSAPNANEKTTTTTPASTTSNASNPNQNNRTKQTISEIEQLKNLGNTRYKAGAFREAIQLYTKAIQNAGVVTPAGGAAPLQLSRSSSGANNTGPTSSSASAGNRNSGQQPEDSPELIQLRQLLATLHSNRAACWLESGASTDQAKDDCKRSIELNPFYSKPYIRLSSILAQTGKISDGCSVLKNRLMTLGDAQQQKGGQNVKPEELAKFKLELEQKLKELNNVENALTAGRVALIEGSVHAAVVAFQQAADVLQQPPDECLLWLVRAHSAAGRNDQANRVCRNVLRKVQGGSSGGNKSGSDEAYIVMALVLFLDGDSLQAENLLREALRLNPDASEAQKNLKNLVKPVGLGLKDGKEKSSVRQFEEALVSYETALGKIQTLVDNTNKDKDKSNLSSPQINQIRNGSVPVASDTETKARALGLALKKSAIYAQLLNETATCLYRLKEFSKCLKTVSTALYVRSDQKDAVILYCNCLVALKRYEEAVAFMEGDVKTMFYNDSMIQHAHRQAVFELRKSKRPDYYAVLSESWGEKEKGGSSGSDGEQGSNGFSNGNGQNGNGVSDKNGASSDKENASKGEQKKASDVDNAVDIPEEDDIEEINAESPPVTPSATKQTTADESSSTAPPATESKPPSQPQSKPLSSFSSLFDIKQAYKQRALELHPDKQQAKSEKEREEAKKRFLLVSEGLEILGDETKRKLYDEGYDKEAIDERIEAMNRAKNRQEGWGHHHHH